LTSENLINAVVRGSPSDVTVEEVEETCKTLKKNKAPGPGGIPDEVVKYGTRKLYTYIQRLVKDCPNRAGVLQEWK